MEMAFLPYGGSVSDLDNLGGEPIQRLAPLESLFEGDFKGDFEGDFERPLDAAREPERFSSVPSGGGDGGFVADRLPPVLPFRFSLSADPVRISLRGSSSRLDGGFSAFLRGLVVLPDDSLAPFESVGLCGFGFVADLASFLPSPDFWSRFALVNLFTDLSTRLDDSLESSGGFSDDSGGVNSGGSVADSGRFLRSPDSLSRIVLDRLFVGLFSRLDDSSEASSRGFANDSGGFVADSE